MAQGNRPDRVAEEIRHVVSEVLAREVKDPGIGFITITSAKISSDLQVARLTYTTMGTAGTPAENEKQRAATKAALERVKPFLRRQIGQKMRLRRVPELSFHFDEGIAHQARVEELLIEIQKDREANPYVEPTDLKVGPTDLKVGPTDLEVGHKKDDESQ